MLFYDCLQNKLKTEVCAACGCKKTNEPTKSKVGDYDFFTKLTSGVTTYIDGGKYYLHLRRELLLTLAVRIIS